MTQQEAIDEVCEVVGLAYHSIADYSYPSDGFCSKCDHVRIDQHYQNSGEAIDYVRRAVLNQLILDGFKIPSNYDPSTGRQIN